MPKFQPGQSGNPDGRPVGSKNKNYLSLNHWFEIINDASSGMEPKEKLEIAFRALGMLLPKVQALPASPSDSVSNAAATLNMVKELESNGEVKRDA